MVRAVSRVLALWGHSPHSVFLPPYLQECSLSDSSQHSFSSLLTAEDVTHMSCHSSFLQLHQCTELPAELGGELCLQTFPESGWVGNWFFGMLWPLVWTGWEWPLVWTGWICSFWTIPHVMSRRLTFFFLSLLIQNLCIAEEIGLWEISSSLQCCRVQIIIHSLLPVTLHGKRWG